MLELITELLAGQIKNTNIIICLSDGDILSDQDNKVQSQKIIIFLKDSHYTIAIKKNDYEFVYFNPLGNGLDQIKRF